ncbi:MAG TPA: exodeoxyribonuclease V subunit gamma, partial [Halomonas sp.]|nr:exodeoxyribonuclease V subunit gamma [Halomonas sp.]
FSYAHEWRAVHHAPSASEPAPDDDAPLPPLEQERPLTLAQLGNFLKAPAKAFFNTRLGVYLDIDDADTLEHEPFDLDGLSLWQLQDALVEAGRLAMDRGAPYLPAVEARLQGLEREGRLAMGGFAERMRTELTEPLDTMFEHYAEALTGWPHAIVQPAAVSLRLGRDDRGAGSDHPFEVRPFEVRLEDWLDGLRESDAGDCCRLVLMTSSLVRKGKYHWRNWLSAWVAHLAGQLAVGPMTTRLISRAGHHTLAPLPESQARDRLDAIAHAWLAGMSAPLPLPVESAFRWVEQDGNAARLLRCLNDEGDDVDLKAWRAAQRCYEGDDYSAGERDRDPCLARQWPSFSAVVRQRAGERHFTELAEVLYAPLHDAVKNSAAKGGKV